LRKLPTFVEARKRNWLRLRAALDRHSDVLEFQLPTHATGWSADGFSWDASGHRSDPSWFGFMIRVRSGARLSRKDLAIALDEAKIGNRMLFGGNLVRQPVFAQRKGLPSPGFRTVGDLAGADAIMNEVLFVGVYPGLTEAMIAHIAATIGKALHGDAR
jgi:CDP-6-deoxy-D-xylo-4-hexulose-3-dehydrase